MRRRGCRRGLCRKIRRTARGPGSGRTCTSATRTSSSSASRRIWRACGPWRANSPPAGTPRVGRPPGACGNRCLTDRTGTSTSETEHRGPVRAEGYRARPGPPEAFGPELGGGAPAVARGTGFAAGTGFIAGADCIAGGGFVDPKDSLNESGGFFCDPRNQRIAAQVPRLSVVSHILSVIRPTPATAGGRRSPRVGVETAS